MGLYQPIVCELERQGHEVVFVEDKMLDYDWKYPYRSVLDRIKRYYDCYRNRRFKKYWDSILAERDDLKQHFDELIVVNGCSFCTYFWQTVRSFNNRLKAVLYLWDNSSFYDYFHYQRLFDKVMTYDLDDSVKYGVKLLPFYWQNKQYGGGIRYKISMIGSNHSGRLDIARKVVSQLKGEGYSYFIKVVDKTIPEDDVVIHMPISPVDVQNIIQESECVLDTDRSTQTGTTPRLIWALASGKKIITTNQNIKRMPLYDPERIAFIDRNAPIIDLTFLGQEVRNKKPSSYLESLRIDKWIQNFLI